MPFFDANPAWVLRPIRNRPLALRAFRALPEQGRIGHPRPVTYTPLDYKKSAKPVSRFGAFGVLLGCY